MKNISILYSKKQILWFGLLAFLCFSFVESCNSKHSAKQTSTSQTENIMSDSNERGALNTLTSKEKKEGWTLLFNGKDMDKWRGTYGAKLPQAWTIKNGTLTVDASNGKQGGGGGNFGSIVTKKMYSNFVFEIDFKLSRGANTGIKYFVVEDPGYFDGDPNGSVIGLEYQLIDDNRPVVHPTNSTGALYAMIPPDTGNKHLNPLGQWNHAKIVSKGCHVEHWLNGEKLLAYQRGSKVFRSLVAESKYNIYKGFGLAPQGHIALQDHGFQVYFRNIKIKVLNSKKCNNL